MENGRDLAFLIHLLPMLFVEIFGGQNHVCKLALALDACRRAVFHLSIRDTGCLRMLVICSGPVLRRVRSVPAVRSELVHDVDLASRISRVCRCSVTLVEGFDKLTNRCGNIFPGRRKYDRTPQNTSNQGKQGLSHRSFLFQTQIRLRFAESLASWIRHVNLYRRIPRMNSALLFPFLQAFGATLESSGQFTRGESCPCQTPFRAEASLPALP